MFVKEVKPFPGEVATFKVQLPYDVPYSVRCGACEYRERYAEGVRYLDFSVKDTDRVEVDFPAVKGKSKKVHLNERVHSLIASMENPHPDWVRKERYNLMSLEDPFSRAEVWIKLKITRDGIYEVTYDMLRSLGVDPDLYPVSTYKMIAMLDTFPSSVDSAAIWGREVAIWVDTAGRRVLFWGEPMASYRVKGDSLIFFRNPYTDTTTYFLGLGGGPGKRLSVKRYASGTPAPPLKVYRWEEERYNPGKKGRIWFGEEMVRVTTDPDRSFVFNLNLDDLVERGVSPTIKSSVATSEFSDTALVVLKVNNYFCDSLRLRPANYGTLSCTPILVRGENEVSFTLKAIATSQTVYLDYYDVIYESDGSYSNAGTFFVNTSGKFTLTLRGNRPVFVWDVSDAYSPKILESYTYSDGVLQVSDSSNGWAKIYVSNFTRRPISLELYTPKGLRNLKADYVAIGSENFASTFSSFLDYRRGHMPKFNSSRWEMGSGSAAWVNLKDIYDEFGLGNPDPTAIRNFLYYMNASSSSQQPLYVVLVGDGSYDYRHLTSSYFADGVPPFYPMDLSLSVNLDNMGAYDDYYVDFDGDGYGNLAIGRIPARTVQELEEYLQKVIKYEALNNDGPWRFQVMLVADDESAGSSSSCELVHTYQVLYQISPNIPHWMVFHPFLLQKYPFEGITKPTATQDLIKFLNEGKLMVSFFVHGNPIQMTHEKLFTLEDVPKLNTQGREPFVTVLSCKVGAYDRLDPPHVLGEELMLKSNRAIAILSSTALSYASSNAYYAQSIYGYIKSYGKAPLGYLAQQGKNLKFYVLLGDPAIMLALPDSVGRLSIFSPLERGAKNETEGGIGKLSVFDLPDYDTVTFTCATSRYPYYTLRPTMFYGKVHSDTASFWIPLRGRLSKANWVRSGNIIVPVFPPDEQILMLHWDGWRAKVGMYPITERRNVLGSSKPRVKGFYAGDELENGFRLPLRAKLKFEFYSAEGFDIRTTGEGASPPRIILDNSTTDVLEAEIVSDTVAHAYYTLDYSSDPGTHNIAVSVTSALGIRGYSMWDLNFVEKDLKVHDLLSYPNPYRGGDFYITFKLTQDADVSLKLYTPNGKLIKSYDLGNLKAGFNSVPLLLPNLANGVYVAVLSASNANGSAKAFTRILILR